MDTAVPDDLLQRLQGFHGTAAAIEFAVLNLQVERIVVCGHSHCDAIRALYGEVPSEADNAGTGPYLAHLSHDQPRPRAQGTAQAWAADDDSTRL